MQTGNAPQQPDTPESGGSEYPSLARIASQVKQQMPPSPAPAEERPDTAMAAEAGEPTEAEPAGETESEEEEAAATDRAEAVPPARPFPAPAQAGTDNAAAFREALVAPSTRKAVARSFETLRQTALEHIETKVEAILTQQISQWLDANLPGMVERMVREEIQRLADLDEIAKLGD